MFIDQRKEYTDIYPFIYLDEGKTYQPRIEVVTNKELDDYGLVRYFNGKIVYTESDVENLTAAFAKAFELAKAAREKVSEKK